MAKAENQSGVQQCARLVKPKAKNAEWDDSTWVHEEDEWHDAQ